LKTMQGTAMPAISLSLSPPSPLPSLICQPHDIAP